MDEPLLDKLTNAPRQFHGDGLSDDEVKVLKLLAGNDYLCAERIASSTGIEQRRAEFLLGRLNEKSLIDEAHIVGRKVEYHIDKNGLEVLAARELLE